MRSLFYSVSVASLSMMSATPLYAQVEAVDPETDEDDTSEENEIVVVASRIFGQLDVPQAPVMVLDEADIQSYGVSSISDLLDVLAPQTGSGRGRGDGRPVILINGQRISNFREFRNIPPEAIRRMEVLPEEVALRYGYPANQRVVNFILKDSFSSKVISAEYNVPTRGGYAESELEASVLNIAGANRFNLNAKIEDSSMLTEAERDIRQSPVTIPVGLGLDPADYRSLVSDSRKLTLTGSWARGLGEGRNSGSLSANAEITRSDSRSLSGLDVVDLVTPNGNNEYFTDPLTRNSRTVGVAGGVAFNKGLDGWQLSTTVDVSQSKIETRVDQSIDGARLQAAVLNGDYIIGNPVPWSLAAPQEVAYTRNRDLKSLVTLSGSPFSMPAGEVNLTVKSGFTYTGIRSSSTRIINDVTKLNRGDLSAGFNLAVPIASKNNEVLEKIGDLSANLSAGVNRLSDFGTLTDWSAGLTWAPLENLSFQASYMVEEAAPSLGELGNPVIFNYNVPTYDFSRNETVLITTSSGGNPNLKRETQRDLKLGMNWKLPGLKNSNLIFEYFRNRSDDVTRAFPLLTPEIEALFPDRVTRDPSGRLIAVDRRSVTYAETKASRFRYGINVAGTIGKPEANRDRAEQDGAGGSPRRRMEGGEGPGAGGPRMGGGRGPGGSGGPRMGSGRGPQGMPGARNDNGQGRWNIAVFHTYRLSEKVLIAPGGPELDLLGGDALSDGGVARHAIEFEGGVFRKGFGLRFNGDWTAPTSLKASGAPSTSDLRYGSIFKVNLRAFVNFDQQKSIVEAVPFLKGARLSFDVKNLFDSRQKVTDNNGEVPLGYQPGYMDPTGRMVGIDFRKMF